MQKTLWNKNWKFWNEGDAFALMWDVNPDAKTVDLPHDAMIYEKRKPDAVNAGNSGYYDGAVYHYSKELFVEEAMQDKTIFLQFEGVYMNAQVYVNSELAAHRPYGYSGFTVALNDYLKFGETNEIRVIARNSGMPNSRWYSGSGIYRDVYLVTGEKIYLPLHGTKVETEVANAELSVIKVTTKVASRKDNRTAICIKRVVKDPKGNVVAEEKSPAFINQGEEISLPIRISIPEADLWSAETPALYHVETTIYEADAYGEPREDVVLDTESTEFGIRKLSLDPVHGFSVNGKQVKLAGACIHHDNGFVGAATYYDFHYRQVQKLKDSGFNAIRMSHHPAAETLLLACDQLGMYVMDETFDMWTRCKTANDYALFFDKWWKEDTKAMVEKDYNHPSVVLYSIGNEIPEIGTAKGASIAREICDYIRSLDMSRYTLASINGLFAVGHRMKEILTEVMETHKDEMSAFKMPDGNVNEFMATMAFGDDIVNHRIVSQCLSNVGSYVDILGYNYMTPRYKNDEKTYKNRVVVGSETYPSAICENWQLVKSIDSLIGDFVWTGWDYIGEAGIGVASYGGSGDGFGTPYPCIMSYTGDYDITGFKKPGAYYAEIAFGVRKRPYICTQHPDHFGDSVNLTPWAMTDAIETWTYPGCQGKKTKVEVYSTGDRVELFLNGTSKGSQPAGVSVNNKAFFEVEYEEGVLEAVSYEGDKEIGRFAIRTAGPSDLKTSVEETRSGKLVYIDVERKDAQGTIDTSKEDLITISDVEGGLAFIGSGDHSPELSYTEGKTKTYNGRAQVVIVKEDPKAEASLIINGEKVRV